MSSKENIPILETQLLNQEKNNKRSKSATETQSKTSSQVSSLTTKEVDFVTTDSHFITKDVLWHKTENMDNKRVDAKDQENNIKDMVNKYKLHDKYSSIDYSHLKIDYFTGFTSGLDTCS